MQSATFDIILPVLYTAVSWTGSFRYILSRGLGNRSKPRFYLIVFFRGIDKEKRIERRHMHMTKTSFLKKKTDKQQTKIFPVFRKLEGLKNKQTNILLYILEIRHLIVMSSQKRRWTMVNHCLKAVTHSFRNAFEANVYKMNVAYK